jgi:hypothetical protein
VKREGLDAHLDVPFVDIEPVFVLPIQIHDLGAQPGLINPFFEIREG